MYEPPVGAPDLGTILEAADRRDADLFAIVEQDLYPCDPQLPLPIAKRTRDYLSRRGLGPAPRKS